jgi:hypothetical protein
MSNDQPLSRRHVLQMTGAGSLGLLLGAAGAEADDAEKRPPLDTLREPARDIPVVADCDLCVIGGSCTGVFAAVAAARLGARVVLWSRTWVCWAGWPWPRW